MTSDHRPVPRAITADDDRLHPPAGDDPTWAETCWFAAAIPERGLGIWTYPLFRTSLGVLSCGVFVWGPDGDALRQQPYHRQWWHLPIPDGVDLNALRLPSGLEYDTDEALRRYRIRYADGDACRLELEFTGIHEPHAVGVDGNTGHLDQFGRVRGELVLHGERLEVDCIEMRDRTWSPRREGRDRVRLGYSYGAASELEAFQCATRLDEEGNEHFMSGFLIRGGAVTSLVSAGRTVTRDADGRPLQIRIDAADAAGHAFGAEGRVVSRMAIESTPPYFVWVSLVEWTTDDGEAAWGEDQDTWSPGRLRRFLRGDEGAWTS
jgi:hypothetical protein